MLAHFNVLLELAFFLGESSIILLLFTELRSSIKKLLEVSLVTFALEKGDFG